METDPAALKSKGFFQQIRQDAFSLRLCTSGGTMSTGYLKKAIEIAETYGGGKIHFTTRQQIEIPFIPAEKVESVYKVLQDGDIKTFIGGPRVRTVVACLGAAVCKFGKIETGGLAQAIHNSYFGRELPAKLKIAVTGCKNNCARVEANDIGIRGADQGYILYFGGCFGHETRIGKTIVPALAAREDVLKALEKTVDFFANNAAKGERLGKLLDRVGVDEFKKILEKGL
jgi:dissimilatory sulfite reductase (desulfoviridin) alpha/beta subunit